MRDKKAEETKRILLDGLLLAINKVINDEYLDWDNTAIILDRLTQSFERVYNAK